HGADVPADEPLSSAAVVEALFSPRAAPRYFRHPNRRRMTMQHDVVSLDEWLTARRDLLRAEKELTHRRDDVARKRLALPWVRIDKDYVFDTTDGQRTLADLFDGRSQLLVQHFMFAPGWKEGCPSCSYMADHTDGMNKHLAN